jgi:gamma-glutamylputrescine oxidase
MKRIEDRWGKPLWKVTFRPKRRALPERVDFAVVGGGFAGLSAAAHLARMIGARMIGARMARGKSVLLLEASELGAGASGRTGGLALADSAAGKLRGLGNVLAGYRKILRQMGVRNAVTLRGVWELGRGGEALDPKDKNVRPMKNSAIAWNDSGRLGVVRSVPGGMADPGRVVAGLARAAERAGAQIAEDAEVCGIDFGDALRLKVRELVGRKMRTKIVVAEKVLFTTNAGSLDLTALQSEAQPKLTFAVATEALTRRQISELGLASGRAFYTLDLPYLWGRLAKGRRIVLGSGLVPDFRTRAGQQRTRAGRSSPWGFMTRFDVRKGQAAARVRWLEKRVRALHPVLRNVRITHRWGGPIAFTKDFRPVFRRHPRSPRVLILGAFAGHGVALSVYLGRWAAQALLGKRKLPRWKAPRHG